MGEKLTLKRLQEAVGGSAAAFRCRRRLQPAGGEGDKVFPPTFAGAVYAAEQRRVHGKDGAVTCVLLDSVQSQGNRMELALQDALDAGEDQDSRPGGGLHRVWADGRRGGRREGRPPDR